MANIPCPYCGKYPQPPHHYKSCQKRRDYIRKNTRGLTELQISQLMETGES